MKRLFLFLAFALAASLPAFAQQEEESLTADTIEDMSRKFLAPDYDYLARVINDSKADFYYPRLLERYIKCDTTISLEELHCLYFGTTLLDNYQPYAEPDQLKEVRDLFDKDDPSEKDFKKARKLLLAAVKENPLFMRTYNYLYIVDNNLFGENSKEVQEDVYHYVTMMSVISYSGDGSSFQDAFHTICVSDAYCFMGYNGIQVQSQSLQFDGNQRYDVYELEENEFGVSKLYFNVTPMFNYLSKIFPSNEKKVKVGDVVDELDIEMGSRVVVKLDKKKKKGHYRFTLLDVQPVSDTLDFSSNEQYFPEDGEENTIIFYFGHSQWTSGKSCEVLMMKSFCKENLSYDTFICGFGDDEFVTTSNNGILTKVRGTEIWNDPLQAVRVGNFRPLK